MNISMYFIDAQKGVPFDCSSQPNFDNLNIQLFVTSPDCHLHIITSLTSTNDYVNIWFPLLTDGMVLGVFLAISSLYAYDVFNNDFERSGLS